MNAIYWSFLTLVLILEPLSTQILPPPSNENSVVYFLRGSMNEGLDASLLYNEVLVSFVNLPSRKFDGVSTNMMEFVLLDNENIIGELAITSYIRYECKPGYHLFWSLGKRNDFVEADLAPGKIYFIIVSGKINIKGPELKPINPENRFWVDEIINFISTHPAEVITAKKINRLHNRIGEKIEIELYRYEEDKSKGIFSGKLTKDMYFRIP